MKRALAVAVFCLMTFSAQVSAQTPALRVAVVIDVSPLPLLDENGRTTKDAASRLAELSLGLDELGALNTPFTLSVSPVFVDELRLDPIIGSTRYAALVRAATQHGLLSRPYADVLLPHLDDAPTVAREIRTGRTASQSLLDAMPSGIAAPPGLALNRVVLQGMKNARLTATLAAANQVGPRPVLADGLTILPAHTVDTDLDAEALLSRYHDSLVVVAPAVHGIASDLTELEDDPRIEIVPIQDLISGSITADASFPAPDAPPPDHGVAYQRAAEAVDGFNGYTLPDNPRRSLFGVLLARARSTASGEEWRTLSERSAVLVDLVEEERELLAASEGSVTLTSRRGTVPVTVINRARYEVRVKISLSSAKLDFPDGASRVVTVSPKGDTFTFVTEAISTGSFPMTVRLTSPDGRVSFAPAEVLVRSTAANIPALALTLGALIFLLLWSSRGVLLRRRRGTTI